jgi:hypothetical protein
MFTNISEWFFKNGATLINISKGYRNISKLILNISFHGELDRVRKKNRVIYFLCVVRGTYK